MVGVITSNVDKAASFKDLSYILDMASPNAVANTFEGHDRARNQFKFILGRLENLVASGAPKTTYENLVNLVEFVQRKLETLPPEKVLGSFDPGERKGRSTRRALELSGGHDLGNMAYHGEYAPS
jgi:hypothetical protein